MRTMFLPILRHIVAALLAVLLRTLFPEGGAAELPDIGAAVDVLVLILYAILEKLMKPLFRSYFGENQSGDTAPPAPPKVL